MSGQAWPGRSRMIPALSVRPGDVVNVPGKRSTIVHVGGVDVGALITLHGRQPWGQRWRDVTRALRPSDRIELLIEDDDPHGGIR